MKVVVLDPALENVNAGDEVISNAIRNLDAPFIAGAEALTTHRLLRRSERGLVGAADVVILGGTNAVSSHMERFRQWMVDPDLARRLARKTVFMGVGWWQYQGAPCAYTKALLRWISHPDLAHSVRDDYTLQRLTGLGLSAQMTGCPTTWRLPADFEGAGRREVAVVTVTDYHQQAEADRAWLGVVRERYARVLAVGMGPGDEAYFASLETGIPYAGHGVDVLSSSVAGADHVGTRLHAGIHAMSLGAPSLVLAVDNRAKEMRRSIGLPVVARDDTMAVARALDAGAPVSLYVPMDVADSWARQFSASA